MTIKIKKLKALYAQCRWDAVVTQAATGEHDRESVPSKPQQPAGHNWVRWYDRQLDELASQFSID